MEGFLNFDKDDLLSFDGLDTEPTENKKEEVKSNIEKKVKDNTNEDPELLEKLLRYSDYFISRITDKEASIGQKQTFFLDNQSQFQQTLSKLEEFYEDFSSEWAVYDDKEKNTANIVKDKISKLKKSIAMLKADIKDEMRKENLTQQKVSKNDRDSILNNNKSIRKVIHNVTGTNDDVSYTHMILAGKTPILINASDNHELLDAIKNVVITKHVSDIKLYKISLEEVPLQISYNFTIDDTTLVL